MDPKRIHLFHLYRTYGYVPLSPKRQSEKFSARLFLLQKTIRGRSPLSYKLKLFADCLACGLLFLPNILFIEYFIVAISSLCFNSDKEKLAASLNNSLAATIAISKPVLATPPTTVAPTLVYKIRGFGLLLFFVVKINAPKTFHFGV